MSSVDNNIEAAEARKMCCASCGIAEVDDVKLKPCDGCDLVRYCGDACKEDHQLQHEASCKERAAELERDEILFRQPESTHRGDCPICMIPLSLYPDESRIYPCCSKTVCEGCSYANLVREADEEVKFKCPFCRHPLQENTEQNIILYEKRVEANDPVAIRQMAVRHYHFRQFDAAFEYHKRAADLGDTQAHYFLASMYLHWKCVENYEQKAIFHLEEAAIAGHPEARYDLSLKDWVKGNIERAVKHWIIAANLGYDVSLKALKEYYKYGLVSKDDFAAALRAHQATVNATKSPQREAAAKHRKVLKGSW